MKKCLTFIKCTAERELKSTSSNAQQKHMHFCISVYMNFILLLYLKHFMIFIKKLDPRMRKSDYKVWQAEFHVSSEIFFFNIKNLNFNRL